MNPFSALKLKPLLENFSNNHPKFFQFMMYASGKMDEGSVAEIRITTSTGETIVTNMKINSEDMELFKEIGNISAKGGQQ